MNSTNNGARNSSALDGLPFRITQKPDGSTTIEIAPTKPMVESTPWVSIVSVVPISDEGKALGHLAGRLKNDGVRVAKVSGVWLAHKSDLLQWLDDEAKRQAETADLPANDGGIEQLAKSFGIGGKR